MSGPRRSDRWELPERLDRRQLEAYRQKLKTLDPEQLESEYKTLHHVIAWNPKRAPSAQAVQEFVQLWRRTRQVLRRRASG